MQDFPMPSGVPLKVDLQRSTASWGDLVHIDDEDKIEAEK